MVCTFRASYSEIWQVYIVCFQVMKARVTDAKQTALEKKVLMFAYLGCQYIVNNVMCRVECCGPVVRDTVPDSACIHKLHYSMPVETAQHCSAMQHTPMHHGKWVLLAVEGEAAVTSCPLWLPTWPQPTQHAISFCLCHQLSFVSKH